MPRVSDILLPLWCLYVTFMIIQSWFTGSVSNLEEFMLSILAWYILIVAGFAVRGRD